MAFKISLLHRTSRTLIQSLTQTNSTSLRTISTFPSLSQEPHIAAEPSPPPPPPPPMETEPAPEPTPLPPNPASGSPLYSENWRSPIPAAVNPAAAAVVPLDFVYQSPTSRVQTLARTLDAKGVMEMLADWTTSQNWSDMKLLFELWVRSLDKTGKPNQPGVELFNSYLRANLMIGANAGELLDLLAQMEDYAVAPNTASFNLVLKAMVRDRESDAAMKLLERMLLTRKQSQPDDESYSLIIDMLLQSNRIDEAFKYLDLSLKSGYTLSLKIFTSCVQACANRRRLDALVSIIDRCKAMDQNKALCPPWNLSYFIADIALQEDNSKLAFLALEFMAKWIARGERARPAELLSVDEGLLISALGTAARTYDATLVAATWAILQRSLRENKAPTPEAFLAKIHALASLGNLQKAFGTLKEFESAHENSRKDVGEELFSPFTSLYPLVMGCSRKGFESLDSVYFQLENLSRANPPYKSIAALNCIILGCANIWDLDRAYQTFEAISSTFGLTPNIHSYNCLMFAFGKLKKTFEASKVFDHMLSLGIKPNALSYTILVDAHLINRDQKTALSVLSSMANAGFEPSKETLRKVKRRCTREMDYESDDRLQSLAKLYEIRLGGENRRDTLFNLNYGAGFAS